jgi:Domain of unknown function (DUF6968)
VSGSSLPADYPSPTAVRRYSVEGEPDRTIVLKIGQPIPPSYSKGDWCCPVLIEGLGDDEIKYAYGIDGIQALQQAMAYARKELHASGLPITWLDNEPGELGLPRTIESAYGLWFQNRLEHIIETEEMRVGEMLTELLKVRARRKREL